MRFYLKRLLKFFLWLLVSLRFKPNSWHFISHFGIGDAYLICSLLKRIEIENPDFKFNLYFTNAKHLAIADVFELRNHYSSIDKKWLYLIADFSVPKVGNPMILHPNFQINGGLLSLIGHAKITLIDVYKILLNQSLQIKPYTPSYTSIPYTKADTGVYKKILIAPEATSINEFDLVFWQKMTSYLSEHGYTFEILAYSDKYKQLPYPKVNFSLSDTFTILQNYFAVISIRSGFCDLISAYNILKIILYPDLVWYGGKLIDSTSLIRMEIAEERYTQELVVNPEQNDTTAQIAQVLSNFNYP